MMKKFVLTAVAIAVATASLAAFAGSSAQLEGVVNINTATKAELSLLPGVGEKKADDIVSYRQSSPFKSASDLTKIKGIGEKLFAKMGKFVTLQGPTTLKVMKVSKKVN